MFQLSSSVKLAGTELLSSFSYLRSYFDDSFLENVYWCILCGGFWETRKSALQYALSGIRSYRVKIPISENGYPIPIWLSDLTVYCNVIEVNFV